jgi:hypothetical protein
MRYLLFQDLIGPHLSLFQGAAKIPATLQDAQLPIDLVPAIMGDLVIAFLDFFETAWDVTPSDLHPSR